MDRIVLHCDLNNFFASVECVRHPEWKDRPLAVCGSVAERHGICLAKNELAKRCGVQTGDTVFRVRQKCPGVILVEPHYEAYEYYSRLTQAIYESYTDQVEPFGCDESWLDVSGSTRLFGDGPAIADQIRARVRRELGLTISVGVSYNKIFAKLGSDMKKPDAVTCIPRGEFRRLIWDLPARDLFGVGRRTAAALERRSIRTIGQIAQTPSVYLHTWLGQTGDMLWRYANGLDDAAVVPQRAEPPIQSISRGMTPLRDLQNAEECASFLWEMAQKVGERLRRNRMLAGGVRIGLRDTNLRVVEFQTALTVPTAHTADIAEAAVALMRRHYDWRYPLRSATVGVFHLTDQEAPRQLSLWCAASEEEGRALDDAVDALRRRYGAHCVHPASYLRLRRGALLAPDDWNPGFSLGEGQRDRGEAIAFGTLF